MVFGHLSHGTLALSPPCATQNQLTPALPPSLHPPQFLSLSLALSLSFLPISQTLSLFSPSPFPVPVPSPAVSLPHIPCLPEQKKIMIMLCCIILAIILASSIGSIFA